MAATTPEPTLDIGPQPLLHLKNILVPTDFSEGALKAVRYGVRLAKQFDAGLTLLHVFAPPEFCYEEAGLSSFETAYEAARQAMQHRLERLHEAVRHAHGLAIEPVFVQGVSYEQIASVARDRQADLVVISTHGYTGLKRLMRLGSTAERVVRLAPCPVIVVREDERDFVD